MRINLAMSCIKNGGCVCCTIINVFIPLLYLHSSGFSYQKIVSIRIAGLFWDSNFLRNTEQLLHFKAEHKPHCRVRQGLQTMDQQNRTGHACLGAWVAVVPSFQAVEKSHKKASFPSNSEATTKVCNFCGFAIKAQWAAVSWNVRMYHVEK